MRNCWQIINRVRIVGGNNMCYIRSKEIWEMDEDSIILFKNEDIELGFELPEQVQEVVDRLDAIYNRHDWENECIQYWAAQEELHSWAKTLIGEKIISTAEFERLLDRYGAW